MAWFLGGMMLGAAVVAASEPRGRSEFCSHESPHRGCVGCWRYLSHDISSLPPPYVYFGRLRVSVVDVEIDASYRHRMEHRHFKRRPHYKLQATQYSPMLPRERDFFYVHEEAPVPSWMLGSRRETDHTDVLDGEHIRQHWQPLDFHLFGTSNARRSPPYDPVVLTFLIRDSRRLFSNKDKYGKFGLDMNQVADISTTSFKQTVSLVLFKGFSKKRLPIGTVNLRLLFESRADLLAHRQSQAAAAAAAAAPAAAVVVPPPLDESVASLHELPPLVPPPVSVDVPADPEHYPGFITAWKADQPNDQYLPGAYAPYYHGQQPTPVPKCQYPPPLHQLEQDNPDGQTPLHDDNDDESSSSSHHSVDPSPVRASLDASALPSAAASSSEAPSRASLDARPQSLDMPRHEHSPGHHHHHHHHHSDLSHRVLPEFLPKDSSHSLLDLPSTPKPEDW